MAANIRGLAHLVSRVADLRDAMHEARDETLREWADDVLDSAENLVPQRTGNLWQALDHKVWESAGRAKVGVWEHDALQYAEYVEKGTSDTPTQPYLVPAFEEHRAGVARSYRAAFRRHFRGEG